MTNTTLPTFNILSEQEHLATKTAGQGKLIKKIKEDLFESLEAKGQLINRKDFAKALFDNRYNNGVNNENIGIPAGKINIGGKEHNINDPKYKDLVSKYEEIINKYPAVSEEKEDKLDNLDNQIAERMILDSQNMIEFKPTDTFKHGKTAEEESKRAYEELNNTKEYENKIEWTVKLLGGKQHFVVKRTEEQIEMLKIIAERVKEIEQEKAPAKTDDEIKKEQDDENKKKLLDKEAKKEQEDALKRKLLDEETKKETEEPKKAKEKGKESIEKIDVTLLVNRDNLAAKLAETRKDKGYPTGTIEIQTGKFIAIEEQPHFIQFKNKYAEAGDNELRITRLDTEFAEQIILNNPPQADITKKYYIQINNDEPGKNTKTEEQLVAESLRCRDALKNIGYNVEYITYTENNETIDENAKTKFNEKFLTKIHTEIERLNQIGIIRSPLEERSLSVYKNLLDGFYDTSTKIKAKVAILDQPGTIHTPLEQRTLSILKQALENIKTEQAISTEKKYHIIRQRTEEEPIPVPPIPDPIPEPIREEDIELNAVISDMGTDVHRERVSLESEEELKDLYKGLGRYNLPKRAYLFLSRGAKRKRMIKAKMEAMAGKAFSATGDATKDQALNEKTENASDRHELELQNKLDKVEKANTVTLQNIQVNTICKEYLKGNINDTQFQTQFNSIVDGDTNIQAVLKGEKITHIGTNILEKLKQQQAKIALNQTVNNELQNYRTTGDQNSINKINTEISKYIKLHQTNPEFMKDYEDMINNIPNAKNKLELYFNHQKAVMNAQIANVKMNIDILIKGKSAYQIENNDRQKGRAYKVGNALDKLPRWIQTAGFVGLSVGTGILTGGLSTVASAAIVTGVSATGVGGMNALKKRTHYTKEQNTHEKNVVTDYRKEQARLAERQNRALNGKRYSWKKYKAKRQLGLYDQTTQENIQITNTLENSITDLSSKIGNLNTYEENYMKKNLIQGRARLRYYREIGHNFLASNEKEQIEKDMKRLEKSLILGTKKVGKTLIDIENMLAKDDLGNDLSYSTVKKDLENSYKKSLIQFKRERRILSAKYGISTAALSAGMSIGMQYLLGTGVFGKDPTPGIDSQKLSASASDQFKLGNAELLDSGTKNNIYNKGIEVLNTKNLPDGTEIIMNYGAGTNHVPVIPGHLTETIYNAKIQQVIHNVNSLNLDQTTKTSLIDHLNQQPRKASWNGTDFTNNYLQGMRCSEYIEQAAKAVADSGKHNITFGLNFDTALNSTTEKMANATFNITTPGTPGIDGSSIRGKFIQLPVFFNTFKDKVVEKKENEENEEKKEEKEKKTIYTFDPKDPNAPYFDDQGKKKPFQAKDIEPYKYGDVEDNDPKTKDTEKKIKDIDQNKKKPYGKDEKLVSTRGHFKPNFDKKDFVTEYPLEFKEKNSTEVANFFTHIAGGTTPFYQRDINEVKKFKEGKISAAQFQTYIKGSIDDDRNMVNDLLTKDPEYSHAIDSVRENVEQVFRKYEIPSSKLPNKNKIKLMGMYDYIAHTNDASMKSAGCNFMLNGAMLINMTFILALSPKSRQIEELKHILSHELIHGSVANNYRDFSDKVEDGFMRRRTGLLLKNKRDMKDRGRGVNEAITEKLTMEVLKSIYGPNYIAPWVAYKEEQEIIDILEKKYNIPFKSFAKATISRDDFNDLVRKTNNNRPSFLTLIYSLMANDINTTKKFLNGEQITIDSKLRDNLHKSLLKNGVLKEEIQKAYPNLIDPQAKPITA